MYVRTAAALLVIGCGQSEQPAEPEPDRLRIVDCPSAPCRETITVVGVALATCYRWSPSDGWSGGTPPEVERCLPTAEDCVLEVSEGSVPLWDVCGCSELPDPACCVAPVEPSASAEALLLELEDDCGLVLSVRVVCEPPIEPPTLRDSCG